MAKRLSNKTFVKKANRIHNNFYDYSLVEYINTLTPITIICPLHGPFQQRPLKHMRGQGCRTCGYISQSQSKSHLHTFVEEATQMFGPQFDYSKVEYKNNQTPVAIICNIHNHKFNQTPANHFKRKNGCKHCRADSTLLVAALRFIMNARRIHGDKYDYSLVEYESSKTAIRIICKLHGEFSMQPGVHIVKGCGCRKCADITRNDSQRLTLEVILTRAKSTHKDRYDYSLVEYKSVDTPITIICRDHGPFQQTPYNHITRKQGCIRCNKFVSNVETEWLDSLAIPREWRQQYIKTSLRTCKVDAYDPITNTVYEFYGDFWHGNPHTYDPNDINNDTKTTFRELYEKTMKREQIIKQYGYNLITMWEQNWALIKYQQCS